MNEKVIYIDRMIFHFNRKAIADCFAKLISNQSDISQEFTIEQEIEFKRNVIKKLINSMIDNITDEEVIFILIIIQLINYFKFYLIFLKQKFRKQKTQ